MESSRSFCIELKVMSCNDLQAFNFFQKLSVYVVVSIVKDDDGNNNNNNKEKQKKKKQQQQQRQKTPIDREGEGNPKWNHVMRFDLKGDDCHDGVVLEFDLRCEAVVFGEKTIGKVRVPIKDLTTTMMMISEDTYLTTPSNSKGTAARFLSYQVRSPDGKPNGVLHFSYKIILDSNPTTTTTTTTTTSLPWAYHPDGPQTHPSSSTEEMEVNYPSSSSSSSSPSLEVEPPSLSGFHYPSVETEPPPPQEVYYSAPEFNYTVPPAPAPPPPPRGMHLPYYCHPPPPPPHHHHHYPPPPPPPPLAGFPYGYGLGSYGYGFQDHYGRNG